MSTFPGSPRLLKGGIVLLDSTSGAVPRIITLQYNPDTLTRSLAILVRLARVFTWEQAQPLLDAIFTRQRTGAGRWAVWRNNAPNSVAGPMPHKRFRVRYGGSD